MRMHVCLSILLGCAILVAGCTREVIYDTPPPVKLKEPAEKKDYYRQLPPGMAALRKMTDPSRHPDFRPAWRADRDALLVALEYSIRWFGYPSTRRYYPVQGITQARAAQSLIAFREILKSARTAAEFHQRIIAAFDVYESVGCDDAGTVLFTGYYTPIFDARLSPDDTYKWPLHKLPPDLVKGREGQCLGRRLADGTIVPYYTRTEIAAGALKGQELVYLKDRFEAYICSVQGSAKLRLRDARLMNVGYHGNNGKPYTSVANALIRDGLLPRAGLSLKRMIQFFDLHPDLMANYLPLNERYIFFQKSDREPTGSLGLPVTAYCSLATDKRIFPRGCLTFVETRIPTATASGTALQAPFGRLLLDQDTGGAIRAPGRADIYIGVGDKAGRIAGWTFSEGRLYYIFLKE